MMGAPYLSWIYLIVYGVGPLLALADNKELRFPTALSASKAMIGTRCYNDSQIYVQADSNREKWASQSK